MHISRLRQHPAHVATDTVVVKETLDLTNSGDSNVAVPELLLGESLDILLGDTANNALDLLR